MGFSRDDLLQKAVLHEKVCQLGNVISCAFVHLVHQPVWVVIMRALHTDLSCCGVHKPYEGAYAVLAYSIAAVLGDSHSSIIA